MASTLVGCTIEEGDLYYHFDDDDIPLNMNDIPLNMNMSFDFVQEEDDNPGFNALDPNCTSLTLELRTFFISFGVFQLSISMFGLCGNTLSLLVLMRKNNRNSSTAIYLIMMALIDNLSLIVHPIQQAVELLRGLPLFLVISWWCTLNNYLDKTTKCISTWMPVLVTAERVMSVRMPSKVKRLCVPQSAVIATAAIWIGFSVIYTVQFIFPVIASRQVNNATTVFSCYMDEDAETLTIFGFIELTMALLLPLLMIFTGNIVIYCHIIISRRRRAKMSTTRDNRMDRQVVAMLAAISISLFVTNFPYGRILDTALFNALDPNTLPIVTEIMNYLPYFNSSINFLLFFMSGSRFRSEVKTLFSCSKNAGNVYGSRRANVSS